MVSGNHPPCHFTELADITSLLLDLIFQSYLLGIVRGIWLMRLLATQHILQCLDCCIYQRIGLSYIGRWYCFQSHIRLNQNLNRDLAYEFR